MPIKASKIETRAPFLIFGILLRQLVVDLERLTQERLETRKEEEEVLIPEKGKYRRKKTLEMKDSSR